MFSINDFFPNCIKAFAEVTKHRVLFRQHHMRHFSQFCHMQGHFQKGLDSQETCLAQTVCFVQKLIGIIANTLKHSQNPSSSKSKHTNSNYIVTHDAAYCPREISFVKTKETREKVFEEMASSLSYLIHPKPSKLVRFCLLVGNHLIRKKCA